MDMGLWNKIKKAATKAVTEVKHFVGKAVSKAGELTNSERLAKVGAKLEERTSATAQIIGISKAYKPTNSSVSVSDIDRINTVLADYVRSQKENIVEVEDALTEVINQFSTDIKDIMDDKVMCDQFENECKKEQNEIRTSLSEFISSRTSSADSECLNIMRMKPSSEKEKAMLAFSKKVQKEAILQTQKKLESTMKNMHMRLTKEFQASYQEIIANDAYTIDMINTYEQDISRKAEIINELNDTIKEAQSVIVFLSVEGVRVLWGK